MAKSKSKGRIYLRGRTWWIRFTAPSGKEVRESAATEDEAKAQAFLVRRMDEEWRVQKLGEKPDYTWEQAVVRYLDESNKKHRDHDLSRLRWVQPYLSGKLLRDIDRELLRKMADDKRRASSASNSNRYMTMVNAILHKAEKDWGWLDQAPSFKLFAVPKARHRFISRDEARRLFNELPEHQRDICMFALATGLRRANVLGLEWADVDFDHYTIRIHADQFKQGNAHSIPINETAVAILRKQLGKNARYVFTFRGERIYNVQVAFKAAAIRAGIWLVERVHEDGPHKGQKYVTSEFRFHDLRHTWASWLRQKGVSLGDIQELGGWHRMETVQRYAGVTAQHMRPMVNILDGEIGQLGGVAIPHKSRTVEG